MYKWLGFHFQAFFANFQSYWSRIKHSLPKAMRVSVYHIHCYVDV